VLASLSLMYLKAQIMIGQIHFGRDIRHGRTDLGRCHGRLRESEGPFHISVVMRHWHPWRAPESPRATLPAGDRVEHSPILRSSRDGGVRWFGCECPRCVSGIVDGVRIARPRAECGSKCGSAPVQRSTSWRNEMPALRVQTQNGL
jgi:hypothetical protein